jgi:hypothetical protein
MEYSRSHLKCVLLFVSVLFSIPIAAQEYRGSIGGTVTDPSGAAIPGVTLTVTSFGREISKAL